MGNSEKLKPTTEIHASKELNAIKLLIVIGNLGLIGGVVDNTITTWYAKNIMVFNNRAALDLSLICLGPVIAITGASLYGRYKNKEEKR